MSKTYDGEASRYINETCRAFFAPHRDINSIECRHNSYGSLFIKLTDAFGDSRFFDATALDPSEICVMLSCVMAGVPVRTQILDREAKREVASLF